MAFLNPFIQKIKKGETPFYRVLGKVVRRVLAPRAPRLPAWLRPVLGGLYEFHWVVIGLWHSFWNLCYCQPLFQGRCTSFGRGVVVDRLPFIRGHVDIHIGNDVWLGGHFTVDSGRFVDHPVLILKDRVKISWHVGISVSKEVIIEEDVMISNGCRISDSDGHPREADLRAQNAPLRLRDIRPVRICKNAWIGNAVHIMKGVTIGEGAVIGANSVVISDVPPFSLALGNPAEVLLRNYGRPSKKLPVAEI